MKKYISEHPVFRGYPQAWNAVCPYTKSKVLSKEESLFCHGDAAHSFFIIVKGWLSLTRQTPDGKETIVGLCTEGDFLGEASLFPNASYPCNAQALAPDTEIAIIPSTVMREAIYNHKEFFSNIMALLNERLSKTQLKLEHLNTLSAAQRIGCFLLNLCKNQGEGSKVIPVPVEKHIIASYLRMKPETFSRSLHQLQEIGIKSKNSCITVSSIAGLREFVCNSCSEFGDCDTTTYVK